MSYRYEPDEFDATEDGPAPVGVHRAQVPAWRSWIPLLIVIVAAPLLAWGAVTLLGSASGAPTATSTPAAAPATPPAAAAPATDDAAPVAQDDAADDAAEETTAPTHEPTAATVDYTTGVTVHNGTSTNGLAGRTGDRLTNAGFRAVTVSQGVYGDTSPESSTVFYATAKDRATAQQIATTLGISAVVESAEATATNPVVIVLRSDFTE